ncbi:ribonuclease H-like domain-containing protein [Tanacetum coccineum]
MFLWCSSSLCGMQETLIRVGYGDDTGLLKFSYNETRYGRENDIHQAFVNLRNISWYFNVQILLQDMFNLWRDSVHCIDDWASYGENRKKKTVVSTAIVFISTAFRLFLSQKKYVVEILDMAHIVNCNPSRIPIDAESKLGSEVIRFLPLLYIGVLQVLYSTSLLLDQIFLMQFSRFLCISWNNFALLVLKHQPDVSRSMQRQSAKHIEIDIHFVRDLVVVGHVRVLHVPSRNQFAYIFTKGLPSALFEKFRTRSGYQQKDRKPSQNDKTEHGMEKTVQNQGQSLKMPKSESILKNTVGCNLYPSDGPGKPNSIFMKTVKTKWALNQLQQPICVQLTKTVKTLKTQS